MISGTLANADYPQNFTFNIQVTDSLGRPTYTTFILVVRVPVNVTTYAPTNFLFNAGTTYVQPPNGNNSITFLASGGIPPYAWSAAGLPSGLNIDRVTGTILGTPAQAGTFPITITAIDSQGTSGTLAWNLQVVAPPLIIMNNTLPSGTVGVPYNQFLNAQRGSQSGYTWTVQGILPPGLTAERPASCPSMCGEQIAGTPAQAGAFTFTATVTDSFGTSAQQSFTLVIH
jgi:hypothetical protein